MSSEDYNNIGLRYGRSTSRCPKLFEADGDEVMEEENKVTTRLLAYHKIKLQGLQKKDKNEKNKHGKEKTKEDPLLWYGFLTIFAAEIIRRCVFLIYGYIVH